MKTPRNALCPCGSGKKYKACCRAADEARARMESLVGADALREAEAAWTRIARETPLWEADVVPVAIPGASEGGGSFVVLMAGEFVAHANLVEPRPAGAGERARAVAAGLVTAGKAIGELPRELRVRDEALAAALRAEAASRGVEVSVGSVEAVDDALGVVLSDVCGDELTPRITIPLRWAETEATDAEVAALFAAAAEFDRAAPWDRMDDSDALTLTLPDGSRWGASVLGSGGMQFGVALYSCVDDLLDLIESDEPEMASFARMRGSALNLSLEPIGVIPRSMRREIKKAGWPVAGPQSYPHVMGVRLPEWRVIAEHVRILTLALRAITLLSRGQDPARETGVEAAYVDHSSLDLFA